MNQASGPLRFDGPRITWRLVHLFSPKVEESAHRHSTVVDQTKESSVSTFLIAQVRGHVLEDCLKALKSRCRKTKLDALPKWWETGSDEMAQLLTALKFETKRQDHQTAIRRSRA